MQPAPSDCRVTRKSNTMDGCLAAGLARQSVKGPKGQRGVFRNGPRGGVVKVRVEGPEGSLVASADHRSQEETERARERERKKKEAAREQVCLWVAPAGGQKDFVVMLALRVCPTSRSQESRRTTLLIA